MWERGSLKRQHHLKLRKEEPSHLCEVTGSSYEYWEGMEIPSKYTYPDFRINRAGIDRGRGWDISWRRRKNQSSPINLGLFRISFIKLCSHRQKASIILKDSRDVEITSYLSNKLQLWVEETMEYGDCSRGLRTKWCLKKSYEFWIFIFSSCFNRKVESHVGRSIPVHKQERILI